MTLAPAPVASCRYLNIDQAAVYLNVSVRFMRRLVADRKIRYYKFGKFLRFDPADLDAFAAAGEVASGDDSEAVTEAWAQFRRLGA
ncbi:MAG TPA: helix-turn-helix domain-containing protein [Propionibacteriaceae bacterium]|nr:helix-turn-helix domain-containing protein [Propionibacteriaceae bacterium]